LKLQILSVGKLKAGPESLLCEDYLKRLRGLGKQAGISQVTVLEFAESQAPAAALRREEEAGHLARAASKRIILDERGKAFSSLELANLLRKHLEQGTPDLAILIGGPDGHTDGIRSSGQTISFGPMTWPHRLVRVMLLEQLYRSVTIMLNHPYHRA
jgi:23S rRNA (pseudouridine1915-N3)-methyltransferase